MGSSDRAKSSIDRVDELLEAPCWVVDLLPERVPADGPGQFFEVERWWMDGSHAIEVRSRFLDFLLRLNCYHDFLAVRADKDDVLNPSPKRLTKWVLRDRGMLNFILEDAGALVSVPSQSTYISLHNPSPELLDQARAIAAASRLFVWQPEQ